MRDEVIVWYRLTEALTAADLEEIGQVLSDEERARRDRFVFERDRRDYAAAHALLRHALSRHAGPHHPREWRILADEFGKPSVDPDQAGAPPLAISLTHTHGLVACAMARATDVGVDAERFRSEFCGNDIAERFFTAAEVGVLERCKETERYRRRFTELWTLKEAFIKAIGLGFRCPLDSFAFDYLGTDLVAFACAVEGRQDEAWQFVLAAPSSGYRLSVAVRCDDARPEYRIGVYDVTGPGSERRTTALRSTHPWRTRFPAPRGTLEL